MSNKLFIYPYNMASKSVRFLAQELDCKIIRTQNSSFRPSKDKTIINWGSASEAIRSYAGDENGCNVINNPSAVNVCSDKFTFLNHLKLNNGNPINIPDFTTSFEQALQWHEQGKIVLGRLNRRSKGGEDIYFNDQDYDNWAGCRFFSVYIPKAQEFRVHIVNGEVIDVTEKKLRRQDENGVDINPEEVNWRVRSYTNGFVFTREQVNPPEDVINQSLAAFNILKRDYNLDFGAFDVIYNKKRGSAYVLECNTAPGIEGTTLTKYKEAIQRMVS